jgi:hypothetical protein
VSEPASGNALFIRFLVVFLIVTHGGAWVVRSFGHSHRRPRWLVALVAAALVAFIVYAVVDWLAVAPVGTG